MKSIIILFALLISLTCSGANAQLAGKGPISGEADWTRVSAKKAGDQMFYVGTAVDASSESQAIQAAEQDAVTQMIKHYFGVKLNYSLQTVESLTQINLTLEKSEQSETLNIQGLTRQNTKSVETKKGKYSAWVQISAPISALKAEKNRLAAERREAARRAAEEAARRRAEREEEKRQQKEHAAAAAQRKKRKSGAMVPLIYIGMTRQVFTDSYPAPESIDRFGTIELFTYPGSWNFCERDSFSCHVIFTDGRISGWQSMNHRFINASISP